jgi:hypothetical protein
MFLADYSECGEAVIVPVRVPWLLGGTASIMPQNSFWCLARKGGGMKDAARKTKEPAH